MEWNGNNERDNLVNKLLKKTKFTCFNLQSFDFANVRVHLGFCTRPSSFFYGYGFEGYPAVYPTGRNLHRASFCSVRQTYTLQVELRH